MTPIDNESTTSSFNLKYAKMVFILATPVMLQQLISAFANLIDNLMVGANGADAINAVGASGQIFFVIMLIGFGISEGTSIFIAQQFGSKKFGEMHLTFLIGILFSLLIGIISAVLVFVFKDELISRFTEVATQKKLAFSYIDIAVFTYPIILINIMIGSAYRSCGNTMVPMLAGVCAIVMNTGLNYLLINGHFGAPALGVVGASIATLVARIVEMGILVVIVEYRRMPFRPNVRDLFRIPMSLVQRVLGKSLPLISNEFLWGLGISTMMALYGSRDANEYTAVQIAGTIANLLWVVMSGFAVSVSILIGQELGRKELIGAKRHSVALLKLALYAGLFIMLFAFCLSLFTIDFYNVSPLIKYNAANVLRVIALYFPLYIVTATLFFILRAGGDVRGVLMMDALYMWAIVVPFAYLIVTYSGWSIVLIYLVVQSADVCKCVIGFYRYKKGYWIKTLV